MCRRGRERVVVVVVVVVVVGSASDEEKLGDEGVEMVRERSVEGRMDVGGELKRYEQGLLEGFFTSDGGLALTKGPRAKVETRHQNTPLYLA